MSHTDPPSTTTAEPTTGGSYYVYSDYQTTTYTPPPPVNVELALQRLIAQLECYDAGRVKLETQGGTRADLDRLTTLLREPFEAKGRYRTHRIALTERVRVREFLYDLGHQDHIGYNHIQLQVRRRINSLAVFYLCRVRRNFDGGNSLVVQDYYLSPGYPMREPRFVSLMQHGKETSHLRLSPYRADVERLVSDRAPQLDTSDELQKTAEPYRGWGFPKASTTDSLLQVAARYIFQPMWHEDQEPGILAAEHFGLPRFRQAIELLYFCLSGELAMLRSFLTEPLYRFFEEIYPQPALHAFLRLLPELDGISINALSEERARKLYRTLMTAFRRFLNTTVTWGLRSEPVPLNKLLFANLGRLELIADALTPLKPVQKACAALERTSEQVIETILNTRPQGLA